MYGVDWSWGTMKNRPRGTVVQGHGRVNDYPIGSMPGRRHAPSPRAPSRRARPATRRAPAAMSARHAGPATSCLGPGMHAVNAYLAVANVAASMDSLVKAFGFSRGVVLPDPD